MSEDTIYVAIAEDQKLFRECLVSLLNGFDRLKVNIEASNGKELLEQLYVAAPTPQVVLLDLTMPEMNGLDTTRQIKKLFPWSGTVFSGTVTAYEVCHALRYQKPL